MKTKFQDKPAQFPQRCPDGKAMKPLTQVLLDRRATPHFKDNPVPDEYLEAILQFAGQAPSGYNLQPWRFIVVRKKENRQRLQKAAYNQEKIIEAPVVIIAFAGKNDWKNYIDDVFDEGVSRGSGRPEKVPEIKKQAAAFLEKSIPQEIWLNRHTMIAVTTMMLVAESYGLDTAPMEGFDPKAVANEFGLPSNAEVIALLAIGFAQEPDKPYAGRFALSEIVHDEHFGQRWNGNGQKGADIIGKIGEQIKRKATEELQPA
ncbi:MAG TPA: nitroreductase family protein [Pseudomonadales bacterium]|nr:nitroreductase family protein [Pseudomonadales bacterium]